MPNGMQMPGMAQGEQAAMQGGQALNLDENPFASIFAQGQAPAAPVQPAPTGQMMQGGIQGQGEEVMMGPEELQPGKTGDNTKPLLGAIQNLHAYISASSDPGTIRLVRNLISALTQLVARDQKQGEQMAQQQMQQMASQQQGASQQAAPMMPQGQPAGGPPAGGQPEMPTMQ